MIGIWRQKHFLQQYSCPHATVKLLPVPCFLVNFTVLGGLHAAISFFAKNQTRTGNGFSSPALVRLSKEFAFLRPQGDNLNVDESVGSRLDDVWSPSSGLHINTRRLPARRLAFRESELRTSFVLRISRLLLGLAQSRQNREILERRRVAFDFSPGGNLFEQAAHDFSRARLG